MDIRICCLLCFVTMRAIDCENAAFAQGAVAASGVFAALRLSPHQREMHAAQGAMQSARFTRGEALARTAMFFVVKHGPNLARSAETFPDVSALFAMGSQTRIC